MRVDLITLHAVQNYGSVLQALATQKILEEHGCDVKVINFIKERVRPENLVRTWAGKNLIKAIIIYPTIIRWNHVFTEFCKKNLNLTDKTYTSNSDFVDYDISADMFCTGSDQVWNSVWNRGILEPLYLNFVPENKYKFAFSASFGQDRLAETEIEKTKDYIMKYSKISVRESSGLEILDNQYGYKNAIQLLDPTLCMNAEFWRKLSTPRKIKEEYILIYNLNRSKEFDAYAKELSRRTGLRLVRLCTRFDQFYRTGKPVLIPEIYDFISLIDNAKYVLTDSFHATAFSINMNTEPICVYPNEFGGRLDGFLNLICSKQRHIQNYNDFEVIDRPVDFERVNDILVNERRKANEFIDSVIKDAELFYARM